MGRRVNTAVWMEKYKRWQIKVQKDGERKTFYSSTPGRKGQRECNAKADAWLDDNLIAPDTRTQKLYDEWFEELKLVGTKSNWRPIDVHWRTWIKPVIGNMKINEISEQNLQTIINHAYAKGKSKKYLKNIRATLTLFIKYCRKCKATSLVIENLVIPRNAPEGKRIILQQNEIVILLTCDKTLFKKKEIVEPYINAYRFEVTTGLRPGEIIGLKWDDVVDNHTIILNRSINYYNETTKGKNDNANREFVLKPIDMNILQKQKAYMLSTGLRSEYVFSNKDGSNIKYGAYYKHWVKYRDYNNISKASPYELRHTFVTVVKELPEGLVKPLVGHSVDMDTYAIYAHEFDGEMERTADLIQDQFAKILNTNKKKETGLA